MLKSCEFYKKNYKMIKKIKWGYYMLKKQWVFSITIKNCCPPFAKVIFLINLFLTLAGLYFKIPLFREELPLWVFLLIPWFLLPLYFGYRGLAGYFAYGALVYLGAYAQGLLKEDYVHLFFELFTLSSGGVIYTVFLEKIKQNYLQFVQTVVNSPNGVMIFSADGRLLYLNDTAKKFHGKKALNLLNSGVPISDLPPEIQKAPHFQLIKKAIRTGEPIVGEIIKGELRGKTYSFLIDVQFFDLPGKGRELFLIGRDITRMVELEDQLKETVAELESMVVKDPLTKLYNYAYLMEQLETSIEFSQKFGNKLALVMLDLDDFARYNDAFGIKAGDVLLQTVAKVLLSVKPSQAILARLGGDEFLYLIPGFSLEEAYVFSEKVQRLLRETDFSGKEVLPNEVISASVGIVVYPDNGKSAEDLMSRAKDALYQAKQYGKNNAKIYFSILEELSRKGNIVKEEIIVSLKTIISIINSRDKYTYGHTERVAEYAEALAKEGGLSAIEVEEIKLGAFFHDLGKIEIPREVLRKNTSLTEEEWALLKQHPVFGAELIKPLKVYDKYLPYILHHHERYDGKGYPSGLKGKEIPLGVRILTIADSFDAMTTDRPYKKGKTIFEAVEELRRCAGTQFDPELMEVFIKYLKRERLDNNARQIS